MKRRLSLLCKISPVEAPARESAERGASMFEMSLSVALVGLITIIAVRSLGVELRGNVNKLTGALNPSLLDAPQLTLEASPLELITSTNPINSKPALVPNGPPTDAKPPIPAGGVPRLR